MSSVRYDLAVASWKTSEVLAIVSYSGHPIAYFPLQFILKGGHPKWEYVIQVLQQITDEVVVGSQWSLSEENGQNVSMESIPRAGKYIYTSNDTSEPSYARGPEYFRRYQPATPGGSVSTRSDSKRSSACQSNFRINVIARDGTCLLTDVPHNKCTAAHIIPYSRPDVYMRVLNIPYEPPLFDASCGLLLRDELHHSFDRLEWSLYHKDGSFYVHCFTLSQSETATLHGKKITCDRFRGLVESRPDPRLVEWHYRQCLMAHIRGFSSGMN